MGHKSDYLAEWLVKHVFDVDSFTAPATVYVGLTDFGGTELSGGAYARQSVPTGIVEWEWDGNWIVNKNTITFPKATGDWGEVTGGLVADSLSGSNILYKASDALVVPKTIGVDDQLVIEPGGLKVQES